MGVLFIRYGILQLARGLRRGVPAQAVAGATILGLGLLRRRRPAKLLYETVVKSGESLVIERPGAGESLRVRG